MKRHGGSKTKVMLALLAVLLISLGYLSSQGAREGNMGMSQANCTSPHKWNEATADKPAHCSKPV